MRTYLLSIFLFLFSTFSFAQSPITIQGQVVDATTQELLIGTNVYPLSDWQRGTSTDDEGQFTLEAATDDTLMVTFIGYEPQLVAATEGELLVKLKANVQNMETVTVEASSLVAEEFSIKKIEQLEIYMNPNAKADPLLAVNSLPAATTLDESANVSLRGSSPAQTGIFLNDVPIYDAVRFAQLNGIGTFSIFNTALIKQLQVFPSNPPLEFGNTSAGLISLQTTDQIPEQASVDAVISPANVGIYASLPTSSTSAVSLFSNYQPSGILQAMNSRALQDLKYFHTLDFGAHYFHQLNEKTSLKVFNYAVNEGYRFASRHPSGDDTFRMQKWRNFTTANLRTQYEHSLLTFNGGFSISDMNLSVGNLDIDTQNQDMYLSANYTRFWDAWTLKTGFTYDDRQADFAGKTPVFDYARATHHPADSFAAQMQVRVPEGYVYSKYQPSQRWTLGLGLRKNVPINDQPDYLSYQFNTHYQLAKQQTVTFSAGRYHQQVIPQSESAASFYCSDQLSLDYQYQRKGKTLSLAVFYKDTQADRVMEQTYGAEAAADIRWSPKLRTQLSYTYLNASVQEEEVSISSPYDLNYFVRGSFTYQISPQWSLSSIFIHRQGTFYQSVVDRVYNSELEVYAPTYASADQALRLPDYNVIDLSISRVWPLSEKLSAVAFGNINNVLNHRNVRGIDYNQDYSQPFNKLFAQRTFYAGVILQWQ
ncbi:TonB-dependent receptor plug domain-containing protein [Tunicatimonas pelagia]|uniref:TonB-dependent receptor plug domain-containing protein n=1 Tax=Tunicatimonas pelagia TaxID=931531 RepID=UPI002665A2A6|nr:carboxypeptidase-like regulatory domain-containing protein [Tunicatimonas pelagia]WKN45707.1 carboxypeptidase-like regulatory domain-containing protein [Tunicatimonas pelagia]